MKKHLKNDYPIRTLCFLVEQGEVPYIQIMKRFAEEINAESGHEDSKTSSCPTKVDSKIRY